MAKKTTVSKKSNSTLSYTMDKDKETKGAIRYNDGEGHNLYFKKEELTAEFGEYPESIVVTVEPA